MVLTKHGLHELSQNGDDLSPEPLVALLQVEHLVHEEEHDSEGDVLGRVGVQNGSDFPVGDRRRPVLALKQFLNGIKELSIH